MTNKISLLSIVNWQNFVPATVLMYIACHCHCISSISAGHLPEVVSAVDTGLTVAPDDDPAEAIEKSDEMTGKEENDDSRSGLPPVVHFPNTKDEGNEPEGFPLKETYADTVKLPPKTDGQPRSDVGKSRLSGRVAVPSSKDSSTLPCATANFGRSRPSYPGTDRNSSGKSMYVQFTLRFMHASFLHS